MNIGTKSDSAEPAGFITEPFELFKEDIGQSADNFAIATPAISTSLQQPKRAGNVIKKFTGVPPNADLKDCAETDSFKYMEFPFKYFNPVQTAFLPEVEKDNNVVVCSDTSSGKTVIAEMVISYILSEIHKKYPEAKASYICPLKALASEKEQDWTDSGHYFYKYNVSILTGDYTLTSERQAELVAADIVCMSSEMLGSRIRRNKAEHNKWLTEDMRVCIVDESHLITAEERGDKLEAAIMKFTAINPGCRIIFLSATMPNVEELGTWLTKLNGKKTSIVHSSYRPVDLEWHFERFRSFPYYAANEKSKIEKAIEVVHRYSQDKFIIFVHGKKTGRKILYRLEDDNVCAKFHNADVSKDERREIEKSFRSKDRGSLRVVVATSTLAYGLNFPARRVIVVGIHRGINLIDSLDVKQEGGRAGRTLIDDHGDAHVLIGDKNAIEDIQFCKRVEPIMSKIHDINMLAFHIVSEITEGNVSTEDEALAWYKRSLAYQQRLFEKYKPEELVSSVIDRLIVCRAISIKKSEGTFYSTAIGKTASWFYFSPFDVSDWAKNFEKVLKTERPLNAQIAWALGNTFSSGQDYAIKLNFPIACEFEKKLSDAKLFISDIQCKHACAWYCILKGIEQNKVPSEIAALAMGYRIDSRRISQAITVLGNVGSYFNQAPGHSLLLELPYRLAYGLGNKGIELLLLPKVGRVTASQIMNSHRIFTCKELVAAHAIGHKVLSEEKWKSVKPLAEEIARIGHIEYLKRKNQRRN